MEIEIVFNASVALLFALIAQGVFTALFLPFKAENKKANKYLAALLFLLALWLCDSFFRASGIYSSNPNLYFLPIYFSLAFGPLIYFYTKSLTQAQFIFSSKNLWHFLPVFLQASLYVFLRCNDYEFRRNFWINIHRPYTYDLELIFGFISLLIYLYLCLSLIKQYKQQIENYFSSLHRITLGWLRSIYLLLALLATFWLIEAVARLIWDYYPVTPVSAITIGFAVLLLAAGGIIQKDLSSVPAFVQSKDTPAMPSIQLSSAEHAALSFQSTKQVEVDEQLLTRIQSVMVEQELFLNQELTLKEFAAALNLPERLVSQTINQGLSMTFIDFVNQHRVARVKALIKDKTYQHMSLLGIAMESGFNSKSTFNRVFKKMTTKSPSQYQKEVQNTN